MNLSFISREVADYKHTYVVIVFNNEKWLHKSLDSILLQQVMPHEVIIGDDFSSDKSREILMSYHEKYPGIIKLVLHPVNVGIYANINSLRKLVTGDIIHFHAGDDWFEGEMILEMNREIKERGLSPTRDSFLLMTNFYRYISGDLSIVNNYKHRNINPITAKIQNLISNREIGMSRCLYDRTPDFNETIGPWADWLWDIGRIVNSDKIIYLNKAYPVYRVGVGITSKRPQAYFDNSYLSTIDEVERQYSQDIGFGNRLFLRMQRARTNFRISRSLSDFGIYVIYLSLVIPLFRSQKKLFSEFGNIAPSRVKRLIKVLK